MMSPKRVKYRKVQKGKNRGKAHRGSDLHNGDFGLAAVEHGKITARQIEASRVTIARHVKKIGKMFIRIFPDKPVTRKPAETRQGGGKGAPEFWVAVVRPGLVLFEVGGASETVAKEAFRLASAKLGLRCRFLARDAH